MLQMGVLVLGAYFCLLSLWWLTQTTARYYHSCQRHTDFRSSVTFPCCCGCKSQPVDGILKIVFAAVLSCAEFSLVGRHEEAEDVFVSSMELGTIYIILLFSGAMDVLTQWGSRTFYQYLDYAGLVLLFAAVAAVLESRAFVTTQPVSSLHSMTACLALASVGVTAVEAVWSDQVLFPVLRSYLLLLQGTWWVHMAVLMQEKTLIVGAGREDTNATVVFFSMIFSCHAAVVFSMVLCLWLLLRKLVERNCCACVGGEGRGPSEDVFLENRVHFNYHVLSRLDSESE